MWKIGDYSNSGIAILGEKDDRGSFYRRYARFADYKNGFLRGDKSLLDEGVQAALDKWASEEKELRFGHFSNRDALDLGNFLVQEVYDSAIDMAVCIRKVNGAILFQHLTENTSLDNQNWMQRKFNTVVYFETSSYFAWAKNAINDRTVASLGLPEKDYVLCGGGFPIKLKFGEFVGVLTVSNLPHEEDHQFITDNVYRWLNEHQLKGK